MKIAAVDFGDARTGLAICDKGELLASPAGVIQEKNFDRAVGKVAQALLELGPQLVVVGHPINMNGSVGPRALHCQDFAQRLQERLGEIPVRLWDERSTTVSAIGYLNATDTRGKKRKAVIDTVAATIILENYLNYRKNNPEALAPEEREN